ncbi:MAG: 30S ribosomal protein S6 [Clostridiales bacterium]|nr:30S ribosomal protein S6 [Clostridiales bacterium]
MIVDPALGEEGIAAVVERITSLISEHGTIESVEDWGKRTLAYEINDRTEGYYTLIHFEAPRSFPAELERIYSITENVLRSIVVSKEEK